MAVLEAGIGAPLTEDMLDVWYDTLGDLDVRDLKVAVRRLLAERTYPGLPPVGQLRKYATENRHGQIATPEAAYKRVRQAISRFGLPINDAEWKALHAFLGESLQAVVRGIGGWQRVCDSPPEDRAVLFAQFRDAWNRMADRTSSHQNLTEDLRPRVGTNPMTPRVATDLSNRLRVVSEDDATSVARLEDNR